MQLEEVRRRVEDALRQPIVDVLWEFLAEQGYVGEVVDGHHDVGWLVQLVGGLVDSLHEQERSPRMAPERRPPSVGRSTWALSLAAAQLAGKDQAVCAFRDEVLDGQLLDWDQLEAWVKHHADPGDAPTGDAPTLYLTAALPSTTRVRRAAGGRYDIEPPLRSVIRAGISTRLLKYATPGDECIHMVATTIGSPLERLRQLAADVAPAYGWDDPQAVMFVLTGTAPLINPIRVSTPSALFRDGMFHPWARRVTIEVDPALSPEIVERAYRKARTEAGLAHTRVLSDKHAELSAFCTQREHQRWSQRFKDWNRTHQRWRYENESNFRRDAIRATLRLLNPNELPGSTPIRAVRGPKQQLSDIEIVFEGPSQPKSDELVRSALAWVQSQGAEPNP
jgi:hypothetical protein